MPRGTIGRARGNRALSILLWLGACGPSASINRSSVVSEIGDSSDANPAGDDGSLDKAGPSGGGGVVGSGLGGSGGDATGGNGTGGDGAGGSGGQLEGGAGGTDDAGTSGGTGGNAVDAAVDTAAPVVDAAVDAGKPSLPSLMVTYELVGATSNLTTAGKLDWVHWGHTSATSVNKKKNSPGLITLKKLGSQPQTHYDSRPATLTWTDGSPTGSVTDISDGIETGDVTNVGFEIHATGNSSRPRTLKIYLGGWQTAAKLTAQVGSSSVATYTDTSFRVTDPGADRIFTFVFQPKSNSDLLVVKWTLEEVLDTYSNVTVQAAALSE